MRTECGRDRPSPTPLSRRLYSGNLKAVTSVSFGTIKRLIGTLKERCQRGARCRSGDAHADRVWTAVAKGRRFALKCDAQPFSTRRRSGEISAR